MMFTRLKQFFRQKQVANPISSEDIAYTDSKVQMYPGIKYNRDTLVRTKGIRIYETMLEDDQVKACMHLRKYPVISSGWRIEAASNDNRAEEIAEFVRFVLDKMPRTFNERLLLFLTALEFGFSISEKIFKIQDSGIYAGKIIISDIKGKHPDGIEFVDDGYGNLIDILQQSSISLPVEKFVIFSNDRRFENYYGTSTLRAAYRPYFSKDINIRFWNIFNERFGAPTAMGMYPEKDKRLKDKIRAILDNLQAKTSITFPDTISVKLLEAQRSSSTNSFLEAIRSYNTAIARAILVPSNLGFSPQGNTGSLAQSQTQFMGFLNWIVAPDQMMTEDVVNEQIVKQLVDLNYGEQAAYPTFHFNPLRRLQIEKLLEVWLKAVQGNAVQNNLDDENTIRELLDFPQRIEEEGDPDAIEEDNLPVDTEPTAIDIVDMLPIVEHKLSTEQAKIQTRINPAKVEAERNKLEDESKETITKILEKQRDVLINQVEKLSKNDKLTQKITAGLTLTNSAKMRLAYKNMLGDAFIQGQSIALKSLPKKFRPHNFTLFAVQVGNFTPKAALKHFEDKSFSVTHIQDEQILSEVKIALSNHIKTGTTIQEAMQDIEDIFLKYIEDPNLVTELTTGHRLETIVRTNTSEAFAMGQLNTYRQPEVKRFVPGVQYSAILDDRTTEICAHLHGKQLRNGDPEVDRLTAPNHFSCRSFWLPIFIGEEVKPMTGGELNKARDLVGKGFY